MTITRTAPLVRNDSTQSRVVGFAFNHPEQRAVVFVVHGAAGEEHDREQIRFDGAAYVQLLTDVAEIRQTRNALEQHLVATGKIPGSVS